MFNPIPSDQYYLLAQCIRSGQVSYKQMFDIFESDPLFKIWYKFKFCQSVEDQVDKDFKIINGKKNDKSDD